MEKNTVGSRGIGIGLSNSDLTRQLRKIVCRIKTTSCEDSDTLIGPIRTCRPHVHNPSTARLSALIVEDHRS